MSGETGRLQSNEVKDLSFQRLSLSIPVESKNYKAINEFLTKVCNLQDGSILEPNLQQVKKEEPILKKDEYINKNDSKSDEELFNILSELIQDSRDIPASKSKPIKSRESVNSRDSNSKNSNSREDSRDFNDNSNPKSKDSDCEPIMKCKITKSNELLPNILFPKDIWLMDIISIKDVQIKTSILMEIVKMMNTELLGEKDLSSIETSMNYYIKLLMAYKVYDVPVRVSSVYTPPDFSLKEEDDEDPLAVLKPTATYNSTHSQSAPNINQLLPKRISGASRERDLLNSSKKRLLTFLGHDSWSSSYSDVSVNDEKPSFMTKSRIYNKLKKHRDLSSSINSNSSASLLSNRSSVVTTSSVNSNKSRRRASSTAPSDLNESRLPASRQIVPQAVILTQEQRFENRKYKHEYYIQLCSLLDVCNKMVSFLNHNETHSSNVLISSSKLITFMDFIKTKVWKFIVIDIFQMILDYAKLKFYEW